jgi:hypothetical protein
LNRGLFERFLNLFGLTIAPHEEKTYHFPPAPDPDRFARMVLSQASKARQEKEM